MRRATAWARATSPAVSSRRGGRKRFSASNAPPITTVHVAERRERAEHERARVPRKPALGGRALQHRRLRPHHRQPVIGGAGAARAAWRPCSRMLPRKRRGGAGTRVQGTEEMFRRSGAQERSIKDIGLEAHCVGERGSRAEGQADGPRVTAREVSIHLKDWTGLMPWTPSPIRHDVGRPEGEIRKPRVNTVGGSRFVIESSASNTLATLLPAGSSRSGETRRR